MDPNHRWSCTQKSEMSLADLPQYNLEHQLKKIKEEHVRYISRLALCSNSSVVGSSTHPTNQSKQNQDQQARNHYALALKGLQLLSSWTAVVMEVYSWKLVNPCDHRNGCKRVSYKIQQLTVNFTLIALTLEISIDQLFV